QLAHFLMRTFEKVFDDPQLVDDFEGRGMDRVATKVAQKILVLLKYDDIHAGARQKIPKHHSRRATAGDATTRAYCVTVFVGHRYLRKKVSGIFGSEPLPHEASARLAPIATQSRDTYRR